MKQTELTVIWSRLRAVLSMCACGIGAFLGGTDALLRALLIAMGIDMMTGFICAFREKTLSSETGFVGIGKKVLILLIVGLAHMMDESIGGSALRSAVLGFYISNEGLSVLENAARLGLPVPGKLKDALTQLHGKGEQDG